MSAAGPRATPYKVGRRRWTLIVLELLIAASAVAGGIGLIWNDVIRMPAYWLHGTPFGNWILPGVLLLVIVAGPMIIAAILELSGSRWSTVGAVLAGATLIGWIAGELLIMQRYNVLQPVMILWGLAVMLVGLWMHPDPRRRC